MTTFKAGDRVRLKSDSGTGTVDEVYEEDGREMLSVVWDISGCCGDGPASDMENLSIQPTGKFRFSSKIKSGFNSKVEGNIFGVGHYTVITAALDHGLSDDVQLLDAAPELLEVVKAMASFDGRNNNAALKAMALAALAKAEGRAT